ncbi:MAG: porin [Novosphingobium sp.]|nr:porin [Novosphingobium sp.]
MSPISRTASALAVGVALSWVTPAQAQDATSVAQELAQMRAQMERMSQRIDELEGQLAQAKADAGAATQAAGEARAAVAEVKENPPVKVAWKGAPELTGKDGFTFKPRGRLQVDTGMVSRPNGITDKSTGFGSEVRRAYLGFDGTLPGGFGYRAEIDVAGSSVEITDLYLTYAASKNMTLTLGQHKPFWSLEELGSDLFTSFTERAALNTSFGFERRLGASATYSKGPLIVQGGVFTDNLSDLNNDENNSWSVDGRVVFAPKLGDGQLHVGGSAHYRELNDSAASVRYRVRPLIHTPDIRFIDTGAISASSETGYGLELAYLSGRFHATGEGHWQKVDRLDGPNPTFFGGYAEVGYFLTGGDTRGYKNGAYDRVKPANPVNKGGMGAVELNLRYDRLDLSDAGIIGGRQNGYQVSVVWTPTDYTRFLLNYGRMQYNDAFIPAAGGDRSYGVNAFGMRAQVDF